MKVERGGTFVSCDLPSVSFTENINNRNTFLNSELSY